MIIKTAALIKSKGVFLFRDQPYSGGVMEFYDAPVLCGRLYDSGQEVGPYQSKYIHKQSDSYIELSRDYVGDQFYLNGSAYTGFAYEFKGDICISERFIEHGWDVDEVTYYSEGQLCSIEIGEDLIQKYRWSDAGVLERFSIHKNSEFMISAEFIDSQLRFFTLTGNYFDKIPELINLVDFPFFQRKKELSSVVCGSQLYLSGDGVTNEILYFLLGSKEPLELRSLHLNNVGFSPDLIGIFVNLDLLGEIRISTAESTKEKWKAWCCGFGSKYMGRQIFLNDESIP